VARARRRLSGPERFLRRHLRGKDKAQVAGVKSMCQLLEMDSDFDATCPLRELAVGAADDDDDD
jgi:hypothetical protein